MTKMNRNTLAVVICAGILAVSGSGMAMAQAPTILAGGVSTENAGGPGAQNAGTQDAGAQGLMQESYRIFGPVLSVEEGRITIDNQSEVSFKGEIVLHISDETSRVLDAVDGFPVQLSDIKVGEVIYVNIGPAMTMSLPPQTTAETVIAKIPADFKAPEMVKVKSMEWHENGDWTLTGADGTVYQIPGECPITPYRTRQMVTLADVTESREILLWTDAEGNGQKIVLFAAEDEML